MATITDQEQSIMAEYRKRYPNHSDLICEDGLHCVGIATRIPVDPPSELKEVWEMRATDGDSHWNETTRRWMVSPVRPLFLTKDYNQGGDNCGMDLRKETGRNNLNGKIYHQFYARYLQLLYGLHHIHLQNGKSPDFSEVCNHELCLDFFQRAAVVRMNLKKVAGNRRCSDKELREYIIRDEDLIRRQMNLYNANIIVACHGSDPTSAGSWDNNPIMDLLSQMYPDLNCILSREPKFLYYSAESSLLVLHEWHMSALVSYASYYEAVSHVGEFINQFPEEATNLFRPLIR